MRIVSEPTSNKRRGLPMSKQQISQPARGTSSALCSLAAVVPWWYIGHLAFKFVLVGEAWRSSPSNEGKSLRIVWCTSNVWRASQRLLTDGNPLWISEGENHFLKVTGTAKATACCVFGGWLRLWMSSNANAKQSQGLGRNMILRSRLSWTVIVDDDDTKVPRLELFRWLLRGPEEISGWRRATPLGL